MLPSSRLHASFISSSGILYTAARFPPRLIGLSSMSRSFTFRAYLAPFFTPPSRLLRSSLTPPSRPNQTVVFYTYFFFLFSFSHILPLCTLPLPPFTVLLLLRLLPSSRHFHSSPLVHTTSTDPSFLLILALSTLFSLSHIIHISSRRCS